MLTYRFDPALPAFLAEAARIDPIGGRACFISGAFLGGPFAHGWRLERGAVLDIGPHVLDMIEAAMGEIVAVAGGRRPARLGVGQLHARVGRDEQRLDVLHRRHPDRPHRDRGVLADRASRSSTAARSTARRGPTGSAPTSSPSPAAPATRPTRPRRCTSNGSSPRSRRNSREVERATMGGCAARRSVDDLLALLARGDGVFDEPEIDGLSHALQCGANLRASHPDDPELAVAGLVHDIADIAFPRRPRRPRRAAARQLVEPLLGARVARLVGAHVEAKRYLVATDPAYRAQLSPRSIETLAPAGRRARRRRRSPRWPPIPTSTAILALRRADERAKDPDARPARARHAGAPLLEQVAR